MQLLTFWVCVLSGLPVLARERVSIDGVLNASIEEHSQVEQIFSSGGDSTSVSARGPSDESGLVKRRVRTSEEKIDIEIGYGTTGIMQTRRDQNNGSSERREMASENDSEVSIDDLNATVPVRFANEAPLKNTTAN